MQTWIFDLDGTLTDSFPLFFKSVDTIFSEHGLATSPEVFRQGLSVPMADFFTAHLGPDARDRALARLRDLSLENARRTQLFAGVADCLELLRSRGREIAVWTARDLESARLTMTSAGLDAFTAHCVSGNCVTRGKPHTEGAELVLKRLGRKAHEAVMVGDHEHDVTAARSAGLYGVRASWNQYWENTACTIADSQFHSVEDFRRWVDERTLSKR